jgi:hypothetical protein
MCCAGVCQLRRGGLTSDEAAEARVVLVRSLIPPRLAAYPRYVRAQMEGTPAEMHPLLVFVLQFLWFLFAWFLIAYLVLWPWSARLSSNARLSAWVAPEMFRVLGAGLLVPNLSPGMPMEFAVATAAGDSVTALLAALAFTGLRQGWTSARGLTWACTIVGSVDLLVAFPHAAATGAILHLSAQWYVPVFAGPPLVICHVACFILLIRGDRSATAH